MISSYRYRCSLEVYVGVLNSRDGTQVSIVYYLV